MQKDEEIRSNARQGIAFVVTKITLVELRQITLKLEILNDIYADFDDASIAASKANAALSLDTILFAPMKLEYNAQQHTTSFLSMMNGIKVFPKFS